MDRLGIDEVAPVIGAGEHPARAVVGEPFTITATVWREGHEAVGADVCWTAPDGTRREIPMSPTAADDDRWYADVVPDTEGLWTFQVVAWSDPWSTWLQGLRAKLTAGHQRLENELESGARLLERLSRRRCRADLPRFVAAAAQLRDTRLTAAERAAVLTTSLLAQVATTPCRELRTPSAEHRVRVERRAAQYSSWYEMFPRSTGGTDAEGRPVHGTLRTAAAELPRIAGMGFDVVYLPPVHPIGRLRRKGRNDTLTARADDVGCPWAIGSAEGGHDALHPELGTVADFGYFVAEARRLGLDVALDLALQCAPDHPWVTRHPEWFTTRPDGSVAHAENPPKAYEDIYPLNFDQAPESLYAEVLRIVRLWISRGVRVFRVDNPHTKPPALWEWLIRTVQESDPDVLFLAEAFTRPAVLEGLAKRGFSQSYTYFTWRTTKQELTDYLTELVAKADFLRPNFWVTTPDILPVELQHAGPRHFAMRAALAATLSPSWGMYSGYELYEGTPLEPGAEDYLDSEKYQLRPRDFTTALREGRSLQPWITELNRLRAANPALQQLRTLRFHPVDNDALLAYTKTDPVGGDTVLCVVNLRPDLPASGTVALDLTPLGPQGLAVAPCDRFDAVDLLRGEKRELGPRIDIHLTPEQAPACIYTWRIG
ncbi:alpha-1,4-glucan--maltose-1-phosphate maltosyltransferase [Streptomyces sp. NPDC091272]|uniref:alpha-1,4-glucan--maltose-1-phosphate maltosyltransferase n=1 Tax=Streptomyces sp. NPDC091272 TaxID=3365981 RepID=UPI003828F5E5